VSSTRDSFRDAVGQLAFVGDLVGGVRLGQYAYTVGGQVVKVGAQGARVKVCVALVTDTGDHAHRSSAYAESGRPKVGDEVWIYRERVFKVDALFVEEETP
jgi:hypothetical protein